MSRSGECFQVPPDVARIRLDRYLSEIYPEQSRSQLQGWIRSGCVLVNNVQVKTGYQLRSGDQILLRLPASEAEPGPLPEPIPLSVVFQDEHLAVVEKPAGLVCHAGAGVHAGTLVNALLYHLGALPTGDVMRPGIVHRLDKLTSGLMVVAKNASAHRALAQQFKSRSVRKEYLALVYGSPVLPLGR